MIHTGIIARIINKVKRSYGNSVDGRKIRALSSNASKVPIKLGSRLVLFFNASTRLEGISQNAGFSILTEIALRAQGIPVAQFVCHAGMSRCVLGTNRINPAINPPCKQCISQSRRMYSEIPHVDFIFDREETLEKQLEGRSVKELTHIAFGGIPLGAIVLPSLRWVLRRHHLVDDEPTRFLYWEFIFSAWNVAINFRSALEQYKPALVVIFNGQTFPEAIAKYVAAEQEIRVISHEVALQPFSCFFTDGEATAYPIKIPTDFELSTSQNEKLDNYLEQRFKGNFSMAGIRFWPDMHGLDETFLKKLEGFKQVVPIFTNVIFDTSQSHANVIFTDMFAWLDSVLAVIKANPETFFVIRAHPDEGRKGKESQESVAHWVEHNQIEKLGNVVFIDSGEPFSSYELIQRSKFVMVYNSTIGLEAAILGKAVLCAGKARFTQLETSYLPKSEEEYRKKLDHFLNATAVTVPAHFKENARKFLYFQLYKTSIPFGEFLKPDDQWKGYVHLKNFKLLDLAPEKSNSMQTILDGLIREESFFLHDS